MNLLSKIFILAIFPSSVFIASIATTSVLFPALVIRISGGLDDYSDTNPFETGIWTYPWIATNIVIVVIAILYRKNKFPQFTRLHSFVSNFETSTKITFIVIAILIGAYVLLSFHEMFEEEIYEDYKRGGKEAIESWQPSDVTKGSSYHVRYFLDFISNNLFGNYKAVPFMASISLLILTYYVTKELTKKRFAGIVALVLVLQSGTFLIYDTSITYDNYWIVFYLLSLYLIFKLWPLSHVSFILSLFSKLLSILFVPMTIFLTLNADIGKKTKIFTTSSYIGMIVIGVFVTRGLDIDRILTAFDWHDFWMALSGISYQMRYDGLVLIFLLQIVVWSFYVAKKGIKSAQTTMVLILGSILSQPLLAALTINSSEPYRFISLVVFFAIASGVLFSKPKQDVST